MALPQVDTQDSSLATAVAGGIIANEMDKAEDELRTMDATLTNVFGSLIDLIRVNERIAKAVEGLFNIQQEQQTGEDLSRGLELEKEREAKRPLSDFLGYKSLFPEMKKVKEGASTIGLILATLLGGITAFYDKLPNWAKDLLGGKPGQAARAEAEKRYPTQSPGEAAPPTNMSKTIQDTRDALRNPFDTDEKKLERTFGNIRTQDEFNQFYRGFNRESGGDLSKRLNTHLTEGEKEKYIEPTLKRLGIDPSQFFAGKYQPTPASVTNKQKIIEAFRYQYYENKEYDWLRNARPIAKEAGMGEREFVQAVTGNNEYGYEAWDRVSDMPVVPEMFPNTVEALDPNSYDARLIEMTIDQHRGKEFIISTDNKGVPISPPPPKSKMDALGVGAAASGKIDRSTRPVTPSANPNVTKAISESGSTPTQVTINQNDNSVHTNTVAGGGGGGRGTGVTTPSATKTTRSSGTLGNTELTDFVHGSM